MIKTAAFIVIIALRLMYQPSQAQQSNSIAPFTSPSSLRHTTGIINIPAKLISFNGSIKNNKVILEWVVGENETADQFEVEKSTDGKNYSLAALVFGTDLPETGNYQFYEKVSGRKTMYRIKLISKNKKAEYSPVIEITPNV